MGKQKRLNTNLVAFLTVLGIVVTVAVVALVVWQGAQRDPEVLARAARERLEAGDLVKAADFYRRAYVASREQASKYLIAAGNCWFELGELGNWFEPLRIAHASRPTDAAVLTALLEGFWRVQAITGRGGVLGDERRRDYAEALLALEPDNTLALVSLAHALWGLRGDENVQRGKELARRAFELAPDDPRVALTQAALREMEIREQLQAERQRGAPQDRLEQLWAEYIDGRPDLLAPAVAAHPADADLVTTYAAYLTEQARRLAGRAAALRSGGDAAQAAALQARSRAALDRAAQTLQTALAERPDSAELHLAGAQCGRLRLALEGEDSGPADRAALIAEIDAAARRAVELDPALFDAYALRAELKLIAPGDEAAGAPPLEERFDAALDIFEQAAQDTLLLAKQNLRARLLERVQRTRMLRQGFSAALEFAARTTDAAARDRILARARRFLDDAQTKYPEDPATQFMAGELAMARGDLTAAIQAFEAADRASQAFGLSPGEYWILAAQVGSLPAEKLAVLYLQAGQLGEAERCADLAVAQYERQLGQIAPVRLVLTLAEINARLDRLEQALELLELYSREYPDDPELAAARSVAMARLDRAGALETVSGTDVAAQFRRYRVALAQEDWTTAGEALRAVLDHPEATEPARAAAREWLVGVELSRARAQAAAKDYAAAEQTLRAVVRDTTASDAQLREALALFVAVMTTANRPAEGRALIEELQQAPPRPGLGPLLESYHVQLSETDPARRDEKLLALIAEVEDPLARARQYFDFYASRNQLERAVPYLAEMRRLQPDDVSLMDREFRIRVHLRQLDAARELLVPLTQYDEGRGVDRVGGATYRGLLALAEGTPQAAERAIQEFEVALRGLPKDADLEVSLARACLAAGRMGPAIAALERAIGINPRHLEARVLAIAAYEQQAAQSAGDEQRELEARAAAHLAEAEKLAPEDANVQAAQARAREKARPLEAIAACRQRWNSDPQDVANILKLAGLYARVANDPRQGSAAERRTVLTEGDAFFDAALGRLADLDLLRLAQSAAAFYGAAGQGEKGVARLRECAARVTGPARVTAELLLAAFYEDLGLPDAAERSYQEAQRVIAQATQDPQERLRLEQQVGREFIDFYQTQRMWPQVVEVCRWLLDRVGAEGEDGQVVRTRLIEALLTDGQLADAATELKDYLARYGEDDTRGRMLRAQWHVLRGDRVAAEQDLGAVLRADPGHILARYTRGVLALRRGAYDQARDDLLEAVARVRQPQLEVLLRDKLAELYERTQKFDLAERELRTMLAVLEGQRGGAGEMQPLVRRLVRLLYGRARQFERAQQLISEYMEKYAGEPVWPFELGRLFEARASANEDLARAAAARGEQARQQEYAGAARQDFASAAPYYERATELAGQNLGAAELALIGRIRALTRADRARDAIAVFEKLPIPRPTPGIRVEAAKAYAAAGQAEAARAQWRQALGEAVELDGTLASGIAGELRQALPAAEAEALLRSLLEAAPAESAARLRMQLLLAAYLANTDATQAALPLLDEVLQRTRRDAAEHRDALMLRAQALERAQGPAAAMPTYREILELDPNNVFAMNNLAYGLVTAEGDAYRPQEARAYAERLWRLVTSDPSAAVVLDTIGWVHFKNDELDLAAAALEQALALESAGIPAVYLHLGQVYAAQRRTADARRVLTRGLELVAGRDDEDARALARNFEEQLGTLP